MVAPTIGYKGEELNLLIRQGATFGPVTGTLTGAGATPVDLTGCVIRGQVRRTAASTGVAAPLLVTLTSPASGVFTYEILAADTALLTAGDDENAADSQYVWDMEMVDTSGRIIPLTWGKVSVFREVTK